VPLQLGGEIDLRVLAFSAAMALISTLFFGLVPAFQTSGFDLATALKAESVGVMGGSRRAWLRSGLIVVQVSLSFVLLVGRTGLACDADRSPPGVARTNGSIRLPALMVEGARKS
jgi:hypothetical protein